MDTAKLAVETMVVDSNIPNLPIDKGGWVNNGTST